MSTQRAPHITWGAVQVWHAPWMQAEFTGHLFPHEPQFAGSICVLVQTPPGQLVSSALQLATHWPMLQFGVVPLHALPQLPQFCPSLSRSTQVLSQNEFPAAHWVTQAPETQLALF